MTEPGAHPAFQIRVRLEQPEDGPAIRRVSEAAFGGTAEAAIVDSLRSAGAVVLSMVAVIGAKETMGEPMVTLEAASVTTWGSEGGAWGEPAGAEAGAGHSVQAGDPAVRDRAVGGQVVGHVLISEVIVTSEQGQVTLLGLGPHGVLPEQQGQGVGTMLVEACLERLRESGRAGIVVVGHPGYYPRFGFIPASRWGLRLEVDVPDDVFMALELSPGRLSEIRGVVRYPPEFGLA